MEAIPGGGWSHHSSDELKTAIKQLGVVFPTPEEDDKAETAIFEALQRELAVKDYEIIDEDNLGYSILSHVSETLSG